MQIKKLAFLICSIFFFSSTIYVNAQVKTVIKDSVKITEINRSIGDIRVIITQYKRLDHKDPLCHAMIRVLKDKQSIDSLVYKEIDPVGGSYGLLVYPDLFSDHLVISKFGGYDGRTIIINNKGKVFDFPGGYIFPDRPKGLLFSFHGSDNGGLSVFDLKSDCLLFRTSDFDDHPYLMYNNSEGRYFFSAEHFEGAGRKETFWEYLTDQKTVRKSGLTPDSPEMMCLPALSDYKNYPVSCE